MKIKDLKYKDIDAIPTTEEGHLIGALVNVCSVIFLVLSGIYINNLLLANEIVFKNSLKVLLLLHSIKVKYLILHITVAL